MSKRLAPVTIFGLSTEGYKIASSLSSYNLQTTIVDENLNVGMQLKRDILERFDSVAALLEDEALLGLEPIEDAISKAKCLFFTPKIRIREMEAKSTIGLRLKTIVKNLSKGTVIFNTLPTSYGGNRENVSLIEKLTGLEAGVSFDYIYAPLVPGTNKPLVLGSIKVNADKALIELLKSALTDVPKILPLQLAELIYSKHIIEKYNSIITELEFFEMLDKESKLALKDFTKNHEIYLESMVDNLFDIKVIADALKTGEPMRYMVTGILKSLESYFKYVVNEVHSIIRDEGLKASRTRILVVWSIDPFEIRGDKTSTLNTLVERLHDCVGDIATFNTIPYLRALRLESGMKMGLPLSMDKENVILACSKDDFELVFKSTKIERPEIRPIIIKANLPIEVV
ncbi:MAG: hypothetical protein QXH58_04460, partial [Nitrososphaerales archaeon]